MADPLPFACPSCGGAPHRVQGPNSLTMVHWILNPGLAINELLLGQRIPREMLLCETCDLPLPERTYVRCPHCEALLPGSVWSRGNAFGHWLGLYCPRCRGAIPQLRNLVARALEVLSSPVWFVPWLLLRDRWVDVEVARAEAMLAEGPPPRTSWIRIGLLWFGGMLFVMFGVVPVVVGMSIAALAATVGWIDWAVPMAAAAAAAGWAGLMLPLCLCAGLLWGVLMKVFMERKPPSTAVKKSSDTGVLNDKI